MFLKLGTTLALCLSLVFIASCGTYQQYIDDEATIAKLKQFNPPTKGKAGVYFYRLEHGYGLDKIQKNIFINGRSAGATVANDFYYVELYPGNYIFSSENGFSRRHFNFELKQDKLYFIQLEIRKNALDGEPSFVRVDDNKAKNDILKLKASLSLYQELEDQYEVHYKNQ